MAFMTQVSALATVMRPAIVPAAPLTSVSNMVAAPPRFANGGTRRRNLRSSASLSAVGVLLLVATGCGSGNDSDASAPVVEAVPSVTSSVVQVVNAAEFSAVVDGSDVTVIDVRTAEEFTTSRLADAELFDIASPDFIDMISTLDTNGRYAVYCRSGNRSAAATAAMLDLGFTDVVELGGGILEWEAAGYPTVSG